ncbi:oligopeptide transporter OPT family [Apodospora peruviana]|uniref:Oligopeptide transporter OPT family n=1 Tax=Apodospora peruviana TaxID=516989 RepID=A0AAE0MA39_9PEZI|nr:oligopeptide transporter OPT family [Apodospora peruviana]
MLHEASFVFGKIWEIYFGEAPINPSQPPQKTPPDEVDSPLATPTDEKDLETDDGYSPPLDPRLKDYPIPLISQTVSLANDRSEPILTFRFFVLATFWVVCGDTISTIYFFKPYSSQLSSYMVQLLSWSMGSIMAHYLPEREHAMVVVAYWGSCRTAFGIGPIRALELYYGRHIPPVYGLLFLVTSQMIGYGFAGLYRDVLVRPPKLFYPGVLPNVSLFNALHSKKRGSTIVSSPLRFFAIVAGTAFCWQWVPGVIFPMLASPPILCYLISNSAIGYILGSGRLGFGLLTLTLDWNYASFFQPLYTPIWADLSQIAGAVAGCWVLYPVLYLTNVLGGDSGEPGSKRLPPMSSGIFDKYGEVYNISMVVSTNARGHVSFNQTALDEYSDPRWTVSYLMYFFWGFVSTTGVLVYALLWYGQDGCRGCSRENNYAGDIYLDLMRDAETVPYWWYLALLAICLCLSLVCLYGADVGLPWWGLLVMCLISAVFIFPSGILFGLANMQVDMGFLSELVAGGLFHGNPSAVLVSMTYGHTVLEQSLNLLSDYKFGFYMKIPEKEMFWAQLYGTLLGPFVNYSFMRIIIDQLGAAMSTITNNNSSWHALRTKNYYSISVLWGVLGPQLIFAKYNWIFWAFLVGLTLIVLAYIVHRLKPEWHIETRCNPVVIMYGATYFPVFETTNLLTSALVAVFFMGYLFRYHPVWFAKYNYLLGVGLDCGSQLTQTVAMFALDLGGFRFPSWWGNDMPLCLMATSRRNIWAMTSLRNAVPDKFNYKSPGQFSAVFLILDYKSIPRRK